MEVVKQFTGTNLNDVPLMMRKLADQIEAGEYGDVPQGVMTIDCPDQSQVHVFLWGKCSPESGHFLLHKAMIKLTT